jgi:hypothetical protein
MHALQRLLRLFRAEAWRMADHHVSQADDGVERRAQLVAHAGNELRFVLARLLQLAVLVLDFVEQAHVLDCNSGLVGKGHHQLNLSVGEWQHMVSCQSDNADWRPFSQQGDAKNGTKAANRSRPISVFGICQNIGNVNNSSFKQHSSRNRTCVNFCRVICHELGKLVKLHR